MAHREFGRATIEQSGGAGNVRRREKMDLFAALLRPLANERGQTMTEYVVTLILAVVPLIIFSRAMQIAIKNYIRPIYFFIGLPIP